MVLGRQYETPEMCMRLRIGVTDDCVTVQSVHVQARRYCLSIASQHGHDVHRPFVPSQRIFWWCLTSRTLADTRCEIVSASVSASSQV